MRVHRLEVVFGKWPPRHFVLLLKCSCQLSSLGVAVFDPPYLRGTVNLLPLFLPLLGSFLLGRRSLEAQREHQQDDGNFLHAHSGAVVGPAEVERWTNCLNNEQEAACSTATTRKLNH